MTDDINPDGQGRAPFDPVNVIGGAAPSPPTQPQPESEPSTADADAIEGSTSWGGVRDE